MNNNLASALPIMVNNYSKLFGVQVRIQGTVAYTNGKVITIPRLDVSNPTQARLAYGYLAHEAAHVRYTDFKILQDENLKGNWILFCLFNILEDCRIEQLISKEFIGVYENLSLLNDYYQKDWLLFCKTLNSKNIINVIFSFIQSYAQVYAQKFKSSRKRAAILWWFLRGKIDKKNLRKICWYARENSLSPDSKTTFNLCLSLLSIINEDKFNDEENQMVKEQNLDDINQDDSSECSSVNPSIKQSIEEFEKACDGELDGVTPNKTLVSIIESNSNFKSSSSREDFGLCYEKECVKGDSNYISQVSDTYAIRNALHHKVRGYVDAYGLASVTGNKINPIKAQKVFLGETQIYKDKILQQDFSTSIHVLVDVSSSMLSTDGENNTRAQEACKVALMLCLALEGIDGIHSMATYFPGESSEYEIALRANEKASFVAPRFDQKPRGSTPLAQALWFAFDKVHALESNRNIVFVITDGMPDSVSNVKSCLEYAKEKNIEIYGISIRSSHITSLLEHSSVIESASMLQEKVFGLFNQLFSLKSQQYTDS